MLIFSCMVIILSLVSGLLMLWRIPNAGPASTCSSDQPDLSKSGADKPVSRASETVSIIIPARNEALRLPPLLQSLNQQDIRPHELIVVDDHSTDDTAKIARAAGAAVIQSGQLDGFWIGKSRACWSGAHAATGDWLLFLDADTKLDQPDSLRRLLATFRSLGGRGSLSFQPFHTVVHYYESLSAIFNIIVMAGMNVFTPWGERFRSTGLFGPCLICMRDDYFAVGGHEAIRGSVMDDLALGDSFHRAGLPVHCFGGRELISFRMYPEGIRQQFEGWTKNFSSAATTINPLVFAMIVCWICGGFSIMTLPISAIRESNPVWIPICIAAYIAYALLLVWLARRTGHFHAFLLVLFPIQLIYFTLLFAWSLYLTKIRHSVSWRGRKIKV